MTDNQIEEKVQRIILDIARVLAMEPISGGSLQAKYLQEKRDRDILAMERAITEILSLLSSVRQETIEEVEKIIGEDEKHKEFECSGTPSYESFCEDTEKCPNARDIRERNKFRVSLRAKLSSLQPIEK